MSIVLMEYKILPEHRTAYLDWMTSKQKAYPELEWYEGTDQPGLFVEGWPNCSYERFQAFKAERKDPGHPEWGKLHEYVPEGKIHIWHFQSVQHNKETGS